MGRGLSDARTLATAFAFHGVTAPGCLCFPSDPASRPAYRTSTYCVPGTPLRNLQLCREPGRVAFTRLLTVLCATLFGAPQGSWEKPPQTEGPASRSAVLAANAAAELIQSRARLEGVKRCQEEQRWVGRRWES